MLNAMGGKSACRSSMIAWHTFPGVKVCVGRFTISRKQRSSSEPTPIPRMGINCTAARSPRLCSVRRILSESSKARLSLVYSDIQGKLAILHSRNAQQDCVRSGVATATQQSTVAESNWVFHLFSTKKHATPTRVRFPLLLP